MDGSITKKDESLFTYTHKGDMSICILDWTVETVTQTRPPYIVVHLKKMRYCGRKSLKLQTTTNIMHVALLKT